MFPSQIFVNDVNIVRAAILKKVSLWLLPFYLIVVATFSYYERLHRRMRTAIVSNLLKLPDGSYSVSDIQDFIGYIIQKHQTLTKAPPIHIYINSINKILVLKVKEGYELELQTLKTTLKIFW